MTSIRGGWRAAIQRSEGRAAWLVGPGVGWLIGFFLIPTLLIVGMSLMRRDLYGGVSPGFTLEHYGRLIDPLYLRIVGRTLWWATICTLTCLGLGYPVAFTIARA